MNFVDPKEYDIPGLVRKNRYKTILPSEYSLPPGRGVHLPWEPLALRKTSTPELGLEVTRRREGGLGAPGEGERPPW